MTPQQPQRLTLPQTQAQRECPMHTVALLRRGLQHPPDLHKGQRLDLTDGATRLVHQPAHVDGHQPAADRGLQRAREHVVGQQHRRRCKAVLDHQAVEALHPHRREPVQPALAQARDDPGTRRRPVPLPGPGRSRCTAMWSNQNLTHSPTVGTRPLASGRPPSRCRSNARTLTVISARVRPRTCRRSRRPSGRRPIETNPCQRPCSSRRMLLRPAFRRVLLPLVLATDITILPGHRLAFAN
jgi:hypothetical protein